MSDDKPSNRRHFLGRLGKTLFGTVAGSGGGAALCENDPRKAETNLLPNGVRVGIGAVLGGVTGFLFEDIADQDIRPGGHLHSTAREATPKDRAVLRNLVVKLDNQESPGIVEVDKPDKSGGLSR